MKANKPAYCLPQPKFSPGDCVVYSEDVYDGVPRVYYRYWSRLLITGSHFATGLWNSNQRGSGWVYTAIEYDGNSDRQIGYHHDDGETFEESEIRLTNKRPSPGFQAFFGVLWLPTKEAANFLGMVPRDLTRGIAGFREGLHYSGNARFRLWNIGALAKYFDMPLEVPELERAHRAMDSVHRGDCPADTGRLKGTFLFQGRKRKPIPLAPIGNTQTLCL